MQVKLKVLRGASAGKEIAIRGSQFVIGRSEECNLRANSDAISRKHCGIKINDDSVLVKDLGSRNGTYVNGNKLEGPHELQMGDQLRIGPLEFLVVISEKQKAATTSSTVAAKSDANNDGEDLGGMISDWLSEADEVDRQGRAGDPETREYKMDDPAEVAFDTAKNSSADAMTQQMPALKPGDKGDKDDAKAKNPDTKNSDTRNLPKPKLTKGSKKEAPKDTQEAAAQTLRKFFNRG